MIKAKFYKRLAKSMKREMENELADELLNKATQLEHESFVYCYSLAVRSWRKYNNLLPFYEFHYYHNTSSLLLLVSYILSIIPLHFVLKYLILELRGQSIACLGPITEMRYNLVAGCFCFVLTKPYFNLLIITISSLGYVSL